MKPMPVLFVGHGSPMNATADNAFTRALAAWGRSAPRPAAVLCVSAHWQARETLFQASPRPETIHDFRGFPPALYHVQYTVPGAPDLARRAAALAGARATEEWGLDHGAWSVLRHVYPKTDVPVVLMSLDGARGFPEHAEIGRRLAPLRREGVLILGSGGAVHNLGEMAPEAHAAPYDWAERFDAAFAGALRRGDRESLLRPHDALPDADRAVPTPDHYLPFAAALGAAEEGERVSFPYEGIEHGSISLRCVQWG